MSGTNPRMTREKRTVEAMLELYCHDQHSTTADLCADCQVLRSYARQRLQRCPFQEGKTTCAKCPVHCYKPQMREHVREILAAVKAASASSPAMNITGVPSSVSAADIISAETWFMALTTLAPGSHSASCSPPEVV